MDAALLALLKFGLLGALYLFLLRIVRVMVQELRGTAPAPAAARPLTTPAATAAPTPRPDRRPPRELVVHAPMSPPAVVSLNGQSLVVGRSPEVDVPIDDHYASDEHAQVQSIDGRWSVKDLGSTNGTFVNGAKIQGPTDVRSGDQIRIGKTRIEVRR